MKYTNIMILILSLFIVTGCEDEKADADNNGGDQLFIDAHTGDIGMGSQLFSFTDSSYADSYDLELIYANSEYNIKLNAAANVLAVKADGSFDSAELPVVGYATDSTDMIIGGSWQDMTSYNFADNHSITSNGQVYFVRTNGYQWIKLEVLYASTIQVRFKYDVVDDTVDPQEVTLDWENGISKYFSFSDASTVDPEPWDIGFLTVPVYAGEQGTFYMPSIILNFARDIQVGIITDTETDYESLTEVPSISQWITDNSNERTFGYEGDNEILVYHPEPPYNHKVIVENPDFGYVIKVDQVHYLVKFADYAAGLVIFQYYKF